MFIKNLKSEGIICGVHYRANHLNDVYSFGKKYNLPKTELCENQTVSIPFHEALKEKDIDKIVRVIKNTDLLE
jgi:dTDP-4-amino-4,6-dideoxygalactose transaminase